MIQFANRLHNVNEYYFSEKLREIQTLKSLGKPIINLGVGNPDLPPPTQVTAAVGKAILEENKHGYQPYKGLAELRNAISQFYQKQYHVSIDPETEILPLFGAKEGIMHLSMAYLNKGDQVLIPNPGYASYISVANLLEAEIITYDLEENKQWQPNFDALEQLDLSKVKMMWVNYPNMPTGAKATYDLFEQLISFGIKHQILIVNDNPYSFILTEKPMSILSVYRAKETAVELNSLSKTFNMAGWRVGMMLGNEAVINNALKVKSNMDSGMYYGLQMGAIAALNVENDWFDYINTHYRNRRAIVWKIADLLGLKYDKNAEGFFVWCKITNQKTSLDLSDYLLHTYDVFVTPGSIFGSSGDEYLRFSLCVDEVQLQEVLQRIDPK